MLSAFPLAVLALLSTSTPAFAACDQAPNSAPLTSAETLKLVEQAKEIQRHLLESLEPCDPARVEKAPSGYLCRVGDAVWRIESETFEGKRVYLDLKSGIKVTEPLDGIDDWVHSWMRCDQRLYELPTAYPPALKRRYHFSLRDSDITTLDKDGIRSVLPGLRGRRFWTDTVDPVNSDFRRYYEGLVGNVAYTFNGTSGDIQNESRLNRFTTAVFCVSRP